MDLSQKTDDELNAIIRNHERVRRTAEPLCQSALAERARRAAPGVDLVKSLAAIHRAAHEQRFLCYGDLAEESRAVWSKVRHKINGQLDDLLRMAKDKGLPMLTAIIVAKPDVPTGRMDGDALAGFVRAAERLGYEVDDAESFYRDQQQAVFRAAQERESFRFVVP